MSNYDIEIDLRKIKGAKEMDVQGETGPEHGIFLPIDNRVGTVTDSYKSIGQVSGCPIWVKRQGIYLKAAALGMRFPADRQSHLIKPHISKEVFERMTEEQVLRVPWIGNLKPWEKQ